MKKMKKNQPQALKGFRDFLPEDMAVRQRVINTLREIFESYGFEPLETPALEYAETLLGKYGAEADKLVYTFKDKGERKVGLRYDLTVPVSRVLAQYQNQIPLPFKRYQIQKVYRAEKPQKGRFREFTQCDIDSFGSSSPLTDAEIIAVTYESLKKLGFEKFTIKINSRQVLFKLMTDLGIKDQSKQLSLIQTIDKLDKKELGEVKKELQEKGLTLGQVDSLLELLNNTKPDENLSELLDYLKLMGVDKSFYQFDPTLVRGLDYYTGPVFETYVEKPKIGSITGGGRYDKLIAQLGGPDIPATGTTIGLDRICEVIKDQKLLPNFSPTPTKALITVFDPKYLACSIKLANNLRQKVNTELYPDPKARLDKQFKYADRKGIPFAIVLGPDEIKQDKISLKNLKTGQQESLDFDTVIKKLTALG